MSICNICDNIVSNTPISISNDKPVIILVAGVFCWGQNEIPYSYWGSDVDSKNLTIREANVGSLTSFHDRACELIAQIIGCKVDYGSEHSTKCGHNQFGKDYSGVGLYSEWSDNKKIHLVGHSAGGNTCRYVQYLLINKGNAGFPYKIFKINGKEIENKITVDSILSITGISAVFNGTPLPYYLGADENTGLVSRKNIKTNIILSIIEVLNKNNIAFPSNNFDLHHWDIDTSNEYFFTPDDRFNDFINSQDHLFYDLTIQGCAKFNSLVGTYPNTYYFGFSTYQEPNIFYFDGQRLFTPFLLFHNYMKEYSYKLFPNIKNQFDTKKTDGQAPLYSQSYPHTFLTLGNIVVKKPINFNINTPTKGQWHSVDIESIVGMTFDHIDIVSESSFSVYSPINFILSFFSKNVQTQKKEFYKFLWNIIRNLK